MTKINNKKTMKFHFEDDISYQLEAVAAITDLFKGLETCRSSFSIPKLSDYNLPGLDNDIIGTGNKIRYARFAEEEMLKNLQEIQLRNGLPQTTVLKSKDFTVEMETGTGKTYVYLRTIFELNKRYDFTKFIIVVPSIAIKEGVYKTLQITEEHFKSLKEYNNPIFNYSVYNSKNPVKVRDFALNTNIEIMIINIDAFNKDKNILRRDAHEKGPEGRALINYIKSTSPIVIIDEPQSVDTTAKSKAAIAELNPLCTLRYSATHVDKYNMVYKLDAVDAYELQIVKQIEVAGLQMENNYNYAYRKLISVNNKAGKITASLELDCKTKKGEIKRKAVNVKVGDSLFAKTGERDVYKNLTVKSIDTRPGNEHVAFREFDAPLYLGEVQGDYCNSDEYKRIQIRKTIEEHLDKELKLAPKGIKVLSLFFIDKVSNYRIYDENGNPQKGKYALMFEKEYDKLIKKEKYSSLFKEVDTESLSEQVHNGYFAMDKTAKDSSGERVFKETSSGTSLDDESAYNLIMKDKEKLLSFDCPLKFIFSHSALREGWDNPNVFQICTLNESKSYIKKRQEIGRGLRISVNQNGERVPGFEVNTLTVMANESYKEFAELLQKEIENDTQIKFGTVEPHFFANITIQNEDGCKSYLGEMNSKKLFNYFKENSYIQHNGKINDSLKDALNKNTIQLPEEFKQHQLEIVNALKKVAGNLNIKDHTQKRSVKLNKNVYLSEDFKDLWDRIKYKTRYHLSFDTNQLVNRCIEEIKKIRIPEPKFIYRVAVAEITQAGVNANVKKEDVTETGEIQLPIPDFLTYLQNETNLKRDTIYKILTESGKLKDISINPQSFIEQVAKIIKNELQNLITDGIKYQKIGDDFYYSQELFDNNELVGHLKDMLEAKKSIYEYVIFDSDVEHNFAKGLELNNNVKLYAKLPAWFKIQTPLGSYNPDWAVLVERNSQEKLYFVVETKGTRSSSGISAKESGKIKCGEAHFKALNSNVIWRHECTFEEFRNNNI